MKTKAEIIQTLRESYGFLASEYSISRLALFGSVARGNLSRSSDIDILVEFSSPIGFRFNQLVEYLENLLDAKVDVLTKDGVKNIRVKEVADSITKDLLYV